MQEGIDYEYIDEELVVSRERKPKKTPSMFDTPLEERTFWGNDKGSELVMLLATRRIRECIRNGVLFDVDDDDLTRRLIKQHKDELKKEQLEIMFHLMDQKQIIVKQDENGKWIITKME